MKNYFVLVLVIFSGCFSVNVPLTIGGTPQDELKAELHLSRTALRGTEFENYKFMGDRLFKECGQIKGGRNFTQDQSVVALSDEMRVVLNQDIGIVFERLSKNDKIMLDAPGNNSSMFDPGKFYLTLSGNGKQAEVKTSVDRVQDTGGLAAELLDLAKHMRGAAGGVMCGNQNFFGIPAS